MDSVIIILWGIVTLREYFRSGLPGAGLLVGIAAIIILSFRGAEYLVAEIYGYIPIGGVDRDPMVAAIGTASAFTLGMGWLFLFHAAFIKGKSQSDQEG